MTEPRYSDGWTDEDRFRELSASWPPGEVSFRSVMRKSDQRVWCAPLGTPDFWAADAADEWVSL